MSGYKDYLSNEMQGDMETPMKPKKTRLSQFRHGGYHSSMDEFFTAGKKSYGVRNIDATKVGTYGSSGRETNPRFSTAEFFGKTFMSNGGEVTTPDNIEKFKETIRQAEGLRLEPYKDTKGYDTIGYGHLLVDGRTGNISVDRIDKKDAEQLLEKDVQVRLKEVNRLLPDFKNFPEDAQQAIFSEYYRGSIGKSDVTRALINAGRYKEAAKEYLNNDEYREAKKDGKLGGITKRFEAVSEALINMSEKNFFNDTIVPKRKPFRYGGGADAGASSSSGDRGYGAGVSKGVSSAGGRKSRDDNQKQTKSIKESGMVKESMEREKTKSSKTREQITQAFNKYGAPIVNPVVNRAYSIFDAVNPLSPNTRIDLDKKKMINVQAIQSIDTPIGVVTFDRTTVRNLPLDRKGLLNPDTEYGANLTGSYRGINYGARIDDTGDIAGGFTADLGPGTLTGSGYYDGSDEKGLNVGYSIPFQKGGLLDRSRKK